MKQILCYELTCPICSEVKYQVEAPPHSQMVCDDCLVERTYQKGFSQDELSLISELPKLTGTRKQLIWAHRIRLDAIVENPSELADQIDKELEAKFWIEWRKKND